MKGQVPRPSGGVGSRSQEETLTKVKRVSRDGPRISRAEDSNDSQFSIFKLTSRNESFV